jgi:hypothetical protein
MAACSIANIVKSSLGPVGLDKMLVDDVGVIYFARIFHLRIMCQLSIIALKFNFMMIANVYTPYCVKTELY